jgi:hypothetical protein
MACSAICAKPPPTAISITTRRKEDDMAASKDKFFDPAKMKSKDKAAVTDDTARAIIAAEATARDKKTEKLRALRMAQDAEAPAEPVKAKRTRKTATR